MASGFDDLLRKAFADRALLFANHVLASHPLACDRLRPHAARRVRIAVTGWPLPRLAPPPLTVSITAAGLLEAAPISGEPAPAEPATATSPADDDAVDLHLSIDLSEPLRWLERTAAGSWPAIEIRGDAALAADASWLLAHVRWDVAADAERFFGPIVANELERSGTKLAAAAEGLVAGMRGLAERLRPR